MSQNVCLEILQCVVVLKVFSKKTQLFRLKKLDKIKLVLG
jgi:hypothetical protein